MAHSEYVEVRKNRDGQERAYIIGSRVRVQDIAVLHDRFGESVEEIANSHFPHLTLAQVRGAIAYFFDHSEAIWAACRQDHEFAMALKRRQEDFDGV
jgi:uncharacterized protein (DUF433 family)